MNQAPISYLTTLAVKAEFLDVFEAQRIRVAFANGSVSEDDSIEQMLVALDSFIGQPQGGIGSEMAYIAFCKIVNSRAAHA